jgi:hypothetical protein
MSNSAQKTTEPEADPPPCDNRLNPPESSPKISFPPLQSIPPKSAHLNHDRHALQQPTSSICRDNHDRIDPTPPPLLPQQSEKQRVTPEKPVSTYQNKALTGDQTSENSPNPPFLRRKQPLPAPNRA